MSPGHGDSPLLVFLHGFCESHEIWEMLMADLAGEWDTHTLNIPGFGGDPLAGDIKGLSGVAEKIYGQFPRQEDLILVGHSLGGYISLEILRLHPDAVSGLVLFHSTSRADSDEKRANRNKTIEFLREHGKEPFLKQFVPSLFAPDNLGHQYGNVEKMMRIASTCPVSTIISYTEWMRDRPDSSDIIGTAGIPILYISGRNDSFIPTSASNEEVDLSEKAMLEVLENAGHLGMLETPGRTTEIVRKYLLEYFTGSRSGD